MLKPYWPACLCIDLSARPSELRERGTEFAGVYHRMLKAEALGHNHSLRSIYIINSHQQAESRSLSPHSHVYSIRRVTERCPARVRFAGLPHEIPHAHCDYRHDERSHKHTQHRQRE